MKALACLLSFSLLLQPAALFAGNVESVQDLSVQPVSPTVSTLRSNVDLLQGVDFSKVLTVTSDQYRARDAVTKAAGAFALPEGYETAPNNEELVAQALILSGAPKEALGKNAERLSALTNALLRVKPAEERQALIAKYAAEAQRAFWLKETDPLGLDPNSSTYLQDRAALVRKRGPESLNSPGEQEPKLQQARVPLFDARSTFSAFLRVMRATMRGRSILSAGAKDYNSPSNADMNASVPQERGRAELLPALRDERLRFGVIKSILAYLQDLSDLVEAAIPIARGDRDETIDLRSQVFDQVSIGAGIHDSIGRNVLANERSGLKTLTIEQTDGIANIFYWARYFFSLNSRNRRTKPGVAPRPGRDNLNLLPDGTIQVDDLDQGDFPVAGSLADASVANRGTADSPILFRNRVVEVLDKTALSEGDTRRYRAEEWPATFRLEVVNHRGARRYIYANRIDQMTGLGKEETRFDDARSNVLVEQRRARTKKDLTAFTGIWYFLDFVRRAGVTTTPLREFADKEIVVVGGQDFGKGDSAKVTIENLLRKADRRAYGDDTAREGEVKTIYWVGPSEADCLKYLAKNRQRYALIADAIKSGRLKLIPGRAASVASNNRSPERFSLAIRQRGARDFKILDADAVILTTGFKDESYKLYRKIVTGDSNGVRFGPTLSLQDSDKVEEVRARVPGVEGTPVVAKKIKGREIYFHGAGAGRIVDPGEQEGVTENVASIFALGGRTAAAFRLLMKTLKPIEFLPRVNMVSPRVDPQLGQGAGESYILARQYPNVPPRVFSDADDYFIKARIASGLQRFRFPAKTTVSLQFTRLDNGGYEVDASPAFGQFRPLAEYLNRNPDFIEALAAVMNQEPSENRLTLDFRAGGRLEDGGDAPAEFVSMRLEEGGKVVARGQRLEDYQFDAQPAGEEEDSPSRVLYVSGSALNGYRLAYEAFEAEADGGAVKRTLSFLFRNRSKKDMRALLLSRLFLIARSLNEDPAETLQRFTVRQGQSLRGLDMESALELFALSQIAFKDSSEKDADLARIVGQYAPRGSGEPTRLKLLVLKRVLNLNEEKSAKLEQAYSEFIGSDVAKDPATMGRRLRTARVDPSALPVFFLARFLGRDEGELFQEFRSFQRQRDDLPRRTVEVLFALGKLGGVAPAQLAAEYGTRLASNDDFAALTEDERLALFAVPFAQRSLNQARRLYFNLFFVE